MDITNYIEFVTLVAAWAIVASIVLQLVNVLGHCLFLKCCRRRGYVAMRTLSRTHKIAHFIGYVIFISIVVFTLGLLMMFFQWLFGII